MALRLIGRDISLGDTTLTATGSSGSSVTQIQNILSAHGYPTGGVDGIFGEKTKQAVIAFQSAQGLPADGIVGPLTWAEMQKLSEPKRNEAPAMQQIAQTAPHVIAPAQPAWSQYLPYVILFGIIYSVMNRK